MYQKRTNKKATKDSAVSPVVGVMLMLVVTIVIAAVVAVFASGLVGTQQPAPIVSASVDLNTKDNITTITFLSVSEPIALSDLQLNLKSTKIIENNTGDGIKNEYKLFSQNEILGSSGAVLSGSKVQEVLALVEANSAKDISPEVLISGLSEGSADWEKYFAMYAKPNSSVNTRFDLLNGDGTAIRLNITDSDLTISSMTKIQQKKPGKGNNGGQFNGWFMTCNPGYTFEKNVNIMQEENLEKLEAGDKVDVELLHIPSNSIVYAKTITVEA